MVASRETWKRVEKRRGCVGCGGSADWGGMRAGAVAGCHGRVPRQSMQSVQAFEEASRERTERGER
jgi:hypothetical protein